MYFNDKRVSIVIFSFRINDKKTILLILMTLLLGCERANIYFFILFDVWTNSYAYPCKSGNKIIFGY